MTPQTLTYGTAGDRPLELDLFLPEEAHAFANAPGTTSDKSPIPNPQSQILPAPAPAPAPGTRLRPGVVCIHGGGWLGGDRRQFHWHAVDLAARGYVVASISYRLMPQAYWPAMLDDCQAAVRWLRANAPRWGLDGQRLGALGSSAGGHLAACLGVRGTLESRGTPCTPRDHETAGISSRVNCVVDVHGVHDFPSMYGKAISAECVRLLGGPPTPRADTWRDASPLSFVDAGVAPTLIFHDPYDALVPFDQAAGFEKAIRGVGRPVRLVPVPGAGHGFVYNHTHLWTGRVWPTIVAWLDRYLRTP